MNNHIYLADNSNQDMFNIEIPAFDTGAEIPAPPVKSETSEIGFLAEKSLISFGVMGACIVLIILVAAIIKKNKKNAEPEIEETYIQKNVQEEVHEEIEIPEHKPVKIKRKNISELSTPSTISKCIKSFLENTKEN